MTDDIIKFDWDNVQELLPVLLKYKKQWDEEARIDIREAAGQVAGVFGIDDLEAFASNKFTAAMENTLGQTFGGDAAQELARIFVENYQPVTDLIINYAQGDIPVSKLGHGLEAMRRASTEGIQKSLQNMLGIPQPAADALSNKFGAYTVSIYCFAATYKIYVAAAHDATLAKERRLEAERLCDEAIAQLKSERAEMEDLVSTYMLGRLLPFGDGVDAMDRAIVKNDDDGFIRANAELWEVFGRNAQYSSAEEFDALMLSDETFKL